MRPIIRLSAVLIRPFFNRAIPKQDTSKPVTQTQQHQFETQKALKFHLSPTSNTPIQLSQISDYSLLTLSQYISNASKHAFTGKEAKVLAKPAKKMLSQLHALSEQSQLEFMCFLKIRKIAQADPQIAQAIKAFLKNKRQTVPKDLYYVFGSQFIYEILKLGRQQNGIQYMLTQLVLMDASQIPEDALTQIQRVVFAKDRITEMTAIISILPKLQLLHEEGGLQQTFLKFEPLLCQKLDFASPRDLNRLIYALKRYYIPTDRILKAITDRIFSMAELFTFRQIKVLIELIDQLGQDATLLLVKQAHSRLITAQKDPEFMKLGASCYFLAMQKTKNILIKHKQPLTIPVTALHQHCQQYIYSLPPKQVTETALAMTNDHMTTPTIKQRTYQKITEILNSRLHEFNYQEVSTIAYCFGKEHRNQALLEKLQDQLCRRMKANPGSNEAAFILWAFTRYHQLRVTTARAVYQQLVPNASTLTQFQLTMALYGALHIAPAFLPITYIIETLYPTLARLQQEMDLQSLILCAFVCKEIAGIQTRQHFCMRVLQGLSSLQVDQLLKCKLFLLSNTRTLRKEELTLLQGIQERLEYLLKPVSGPEQPIK